MVVTVTAELHPQPGNQDDDPYVIFLFSSDEHIAAIFTAAVAAHALAGVVTPLPPTFQAPAVGAGEYIP